MQAPSGAVCAGSNPAGGTLHEVPKDPAISAVAENGVFAYVQPYAGVRGRDLGVGRQVSPACRLSSRCPEKLQGPSRRNCCLR